MKLEKLIANICDTSDLTDAEVREELAAEGIDLDAAKARTMAKTDALLAARAVRLAIAAVRANPHSAWGALPWRASGYRVLSKTGNILTDTVLPQDAACIAAAVNAAPLLVAEVERLQAVVEAARVAVEKWKPAHSEMCGRVCHSNCCAHTESNAARTEARRALGLEVSP